MKKMKDKVRTWWYGDPKAGCEGSSVYLISPIPHWSARAIQNTGKYIVKHHWKIITTLLVIIGLLIQWYIYKHPPDQKFPVPISTGYEGTRTPRR
jgi:hypothetical protein